MFLDLRKARLPAWREFRRFRGSGNAADGRCVAIRRVGMNIDEMVEGKDTEREPHWRGGRYSHFQENPGRQGQGSDHSKIYGVSGASLHPTIELVDPIHQGSRGVGMSSQKLCFLRKQVLDTGELTHLGRGRQR